MDLSFGFFIDLNCILTQFTNITFSSPPLSTPLVRLSSSPFLSPISFILQYSFSFSFPFHSHSPSPSPQFLFLLPYYHFSRLPPPLRSSSLYHFPPLQLHPYLSSLSPPLTPCLSRPLPTPCSSPNSSPSTPSLLYPSPLPPTPPFTPFSYPLLLPPLLPHPSPPSSYLPPPPFFTQHLPHPSTPHPHPIPQPLHPSPHPPSLTPSPNPFTRPLTPSPQPLHPPPHPIPPTPSPAPHPSPQPLHPAPSPHPPTPHPAPLTTSPQPPHPAEIHGLRRPPPARGRVRPLPEAAHLPHLPAGLHPLRLPRLQPAVHEPFPSPLVPRPRAGGGRGIHAGGDQEPHYPCDSSILSFSSLSQTEAAQLPQLLPQSQKFIVILSFCFFTLRKLTTTSTTSPIPDHIRDFVTLFISQLPTLHTTSHKYFVLPFLSSCIDIVFDSPQTDHNSTTLTPDIIQGTFSQCSQYLVRNFTAVALSGQLKPDPSWPVVPCMNGWHYDTSVIFSSIVIDYDLVCERAIYPTVGLSVLNIGGIIGVYIFGTISDRFGRRVSFLVCLAVEQVFGLLTAFAPDFWSWIACRFMVGLTVPAIYQIPFIISLELVGPSYRSFVTVMTCLFYVGGMLLLAGVAYLVRNWVHLCLVTSLPFFTYVVYWWYLPESPRWLLAQGRLHEASTILNKMAEVNKTELPESFMHKLKDRMIAQQALSSNSSQKSSGVGFCSMYKTPNMRLKVILITIVWFANETVYVGLSYYGPAMGDDEYLSFFLACAVEVPSYLLCWIVMDRWGRRWILGVGMILGGIFSICTVLMPEGKMVLNVLLLFFSLSRNLSCSAKDIEYGRRGLYSSSPFV
ncbi:putative organic cation transporter protein isoform X2 [Penaeus vannamei]|uniref:Putative organic cation transporter protein isoform X2 n=1 Tax=Penaeus vannamei TaxID=6689 RepID=A0A3R7LUM2_PENVA|nr:putative organic cation transporter protein isoform X2 [Penaeus vannamei]